MIGPRSTATETSRGVFAHARRVAFAGVLTLGVSVSLPMLTTSASAVTGPCPTDAGQATGCGVIITVNPTAPFITVATPGNHNPYEGQDDTLVGIVNNSGVPLSSINLSSSNNIFGFDGDGVCHASASSAGGGFPFTGDGYCASLPSGATGYEGPNNTFSNYDKVHPTTADSGTVVFTSPIASGQSTWWSLESNLTGCETSSACVTIPPGKLTISKTDNTGKPLVGGTYAVFNDKAPHAGSAIGTCTITALDTSGNATCSNTALSQLSPGVYYIDETNPPTGFTAASETSVLVLGNTTVTIVDDPIPVTAPAGTTTTAPPATTTTTAPVIAQATSVHTGKPFAGSVPYVAAAIALGGSLLGLGLARRRRDARRAS